MKQSIELNIEQLVLYGFPNADRFHIGNAVEKELTRLLTEQGLPSSLSQANEIPFIQGGSFQMPPKISASAVGDQVAHTVYTGLNIDK